MKIVIIGGHLSPALAIIENLRQKNDVLFIGRRKTFEGDEAESLEYKMMDKLHIPFVSIPSARLQRKFTKYTLFSLLKLPIGFFKSLMILRSFRPQIILGFGGYLQVPVIFASFFLNIPAVIHEQTLEAGLANRICSLIARKVCISWETSKIFFPREKIILTGNPIRRTFLNTKYKTQNSKLTGSKLPLIYLTGGSSGAHFINNLVEKCLLELLKSFRIIHQTGDAKKYKDYDRLNALKNTLKENLRVNYEIRKFISDDKKLAEIYRDSDIVVSRAGINTVSELIYFEKPSILIPIPFSQKNEQRKNAVFMKKLGLCEILEQEKANPENFLETLLKIKANVADYKIKNSGKKYFRENASEKIVKVLENEAQKK